MNHIGELASLFTSLCFTGTSVFFTLSGQRVGSAVVNRVRVVIALTFLMIWNWILLGQPLPLDAEPEHWLWFALSGAIGYAIGDAFLFQAFIWIGVQKSMLLMSLAPILSAILAWIFFDEILTNKQWLGIWVTLLGIAWVISRRDASNEPSTHKATLGVLFGLGAAIGQAVGFVLSKQGLEGGFSPVAGNAIRMLTATVILWGLLLVQRKVGKTVETIRSQPRVFGMITLGAFLGPVLGVSSSLYALRFTQVGIASTLIALPPIFLLPVGWLVFKQKFDWQAVAGTLVAIGGVAMLFLT